ncbi:hypothetical protein BDW22DRAFT_1160382 [Trametopsis cervina]|nr:hypothetical protein BDW22DRAFT_1160382 [Trametopsis cervina]
MRTTRAGTLPCHECIQCMRSWRASIVPLATGTRLYSQSPTDGVVFVATLPHTASTKPVVWSARTLVLLPAGGPLANLRPAYANPTAFHTVDLRVTSPECGPPKLKRSLGRASMLRLRDLSRTSPVHSADWPLWRSHRPGLAAGDTPDLGVH